MRWYQSRDIAGLTARALAAGALALTLGAAATATAQSGGLSPMNEGVVTQGDKVQIVVDAHDGLSDADVKQLGRAAGVDLALNSIHSDDANLYVAWVPGDKVEAVLDAIVKMDGIEYAEPNMLVQAFGPCGMKDKSSWSAPAEETAAAVNDPLYQYQWHFEQIGVEGAWKKSTGKGAIVSVIDTGVAYKGKGEKFTQTPDLKGTGFVGGYDFVDDDDEALDEHGHGTHVAGTIAQTTNNGYGVAGIAYNAKIMPIRVLNKNGFGSVSDIADGIRWSADNGAHIINMSLGGPLPSLSMRSAIQYAHSKGTTVIAAAGNSGRKMKSYPAAYKNVIAVAATQYDKKTTFYSQWGDFVDIAAPGGNTRVDQNRDGRPDGVMQQTLKRGSTTEHEFALYMGTSMAAPHVAGVAALLVANGITNPERIEQILKDTADSSGKDKIDNYAEHFGAGIMNADAATGDTAVNHNIMRIAMAILLLILLIIGVSRKDMLGTTSLRERWPAFIGLVMGASGLFFLPMLCGDMAVCGATIDLLSRPLAMLDLTILGPGHHQNALLASALIPLAALGLFLGKGRLGALAVGLAVGFAGFLFVESYLMTSDIQWIPGAAGWLDRAWLVANGALSTALAWAALKRY